MIHGYVLGEVFRTEKSKCKGPEAKGHLSCLRSSTEASVVETVSQGGCRGEPVKR